MKRISEQAFYITAKSKMHQYSLIAHVRLLHQRGHPWYSGSAHDCWPTSRAIDPAPGAFHNKIHSIRPGCFRPSIALTMQNRGLRQQMHFISFAPELDLRCTLLEFMKQLIYQ